MVRPMRWAWILLLSCAALFGVPAVIAGHWTFAVPYLLVTIGAAYWLSPWQGGRTARHADLTPGDREKVIVYWRPGCIFCARLRGRLGRHRKKSIWINIWQDAQAAAFVRSVNNGAETVPTVVIDGVPQTNPDPQLVLNRLLEESPHSG